MYPSGPDTINKTYNLMESTNGGRRWSQIDDGLAINGSSDDGGRETPLLLISPSNVVYLISWAGGQPTLINEGVDGAGPYTAALVPGSWQSGDNDPYAAAAIDSNGNLYVQENTASSTAGTSADSGYLGNLGWTTGGTGHFSWHFARRHTWPGMIIAIRTLLSSLGRGAFDVIATRDVSCNNAAFDAQYGYGSAAGGGYVLDAVQDWHTNNINARGGPQWTITPIAHDYTNTCGGGFVSENEFAEMPTAIRTATSTSCTLTRSSGSGAITPCLVPRGRHGD